MNHSQIYPFPLQSQPSENVPTSNAVLPAVNQQQAILPDLTEITSDFPVTDMSTMFDDGLFNGTQEEDSTPLGCGFINAAAPPVDDDFYFKYIQETEAAAIQSLTTTTTHHAPAFDVSASAFHAAASLQSSVHYEGLSFIMLSYFVQL